MIQALAQARKALEALERAATEVSRLGATTGPQWSKLTGALISARSALAAIDAALEGGAAPKVKSYQERVNDWMLTCFNDEIAFSVTERNHRFLEEALELVQAKGCTSSEAYQLVDYVFGRDTGEPTQEVGGVLVCLAALCNAAAINMNAAGETELARIWTKVEKIRAKHAAKPQFSPLPGSLPSPQTGA